MHAVRGASLPAARGRGAGLARLGSRAAALVGLLAMLGALAVLAIDAAAGPSRYVPADSGGWPGWLSGPLSGLGTHLGSGGFEALMLAVCGSYLLVLLGARSLSWRWLAGGIVLAHVILALGPPLISQDVFGYISFARMGTLHSLDPYTRFAAEAPADQVFPFIGWPFQHSPYGPLFTLSTYAAVPLGLAGALVDAESGVRAGEPRRGVADRARRGAPRPLRRVRGRVPRPEPGAARADRRGRPQRHAAARLARVRAAAGCRRRAAPPGGRARGRGRRRREADRGSRAPLHGPGRTARASHEDGARSRRRARRGHRGRRGRVRPARARLPRRARRAAADGRHPQRPGRDRTARGARRNDLLVARPVGRRLPRRARLRAVAHRPRRRLARGGGLDDDRAARLDRVAAAVVRGLAAAASGRLRRSATAGGSARPLRLRRPDPPAPRGPRAEPRARARRGAAAARVRRAPRARPR